jgi:ATP-binding cassette, subfamily F, member 3
MIRLDKVTIRRGVKVVIDSASLVLQPGEKVGIVGANGAGKSSLFGLLLGELHEDLGEYSVPSQWQRASVAQDTPDSAGSATEFVLEGDTPYLEAVKALEAAHDHHDGTEIAHAQEAYEHAGGYTARPRAEALLLGLGFKRHEIDQPVNSFSGGWRMRLALARALMCPSQLLLLDEPTNHLDLDALLWLEQWLKRYEGTLLVISHDREFLDAVTKVTVHVDAGKLTRYGGNYSKFEEMRAERLLQEAAAFTGQQQQIAKLTKFIDRFGAKASKAKQAQSRAKQLERMEKLAPVYAANEFRFDFLEPIKVPQQPVSLEEVDCGYADKAILSRVTRPVLAGSRIGVLGANGQGKSTLIKTITGSLQPLSGEVRYGKDIAVGYFAQHELDVLRADESPMQHMVRLAKTSNPGAREQELRNWLGRFMFKNEMSQQAVGSFSGGEKARLVLAMLVYQRPNLLLLDEPTNHLDMATREALTMALAQYEGAMLLVSHDRALLRAACDNFWLVAHGKVDDFDGDLEDYQRWVLNAARQAANQPSTKAMITAPATPSTPSTITVAPPAPENTQRGKGSKEDKRRDAQVRSAQAAQKKPLLDAVKKAEAAIATLEPQLKTIESELANPDTYASMKPEELNKKMKESAALREKIEAHEKIWLEQHTALEKLAAAQLSEADSV